MRKFFSRQKVSSSGFNHFMSNKKISLLVIAAVFVILFTLFNHERRFLINLTDALFFMGIAYLILGMVTYIHNIGLFKIFGYWRYKFSSGAYGKRFAEVKTMNLAEYTVNIHSTKQKWSGKFFYIYGLGLTASSYFLVFIISYFFSN